MDSNQIVMIITIAAYMIGMIGIGIYYANKNKNTGDYYLGGRQLGPFVTAMSAEASDMSGWLLMGLPGVAYACGLAEATWTAIGLAIGTYINWLVVAKRLRRYTYAANNSITLPEFFSNRYGDKSKILMCISAAMIFVFFVPYTASGFAACGKIFSTLFGVDYVTAMIISAVVILVYTAIGGFMAASTTDFIQGILMTAALIGVLGFGVYAAGGVENVMTNAQELEGALDVFKGHDYVTGTAGDYGFLPVVSTLAWGLGYFGMPAILLRFMAIRKEEDVKTSRRVASVWVVVSLAVAVVIGMVGFTAVPNLVSSEESQAAVSVPTAMGDNNKYYDEVTDTAYFLAVADDKETAENEERYVSIANYSATEFSKQSMDDIVIKGVDDNNDEVIDRYFVTYNQSENVISRMAMMISEYGWIFAILGGLIIAGMLAATMSTADSQMLAASSSVAQDFFKGKIKPDVSDKVAMWIARGTVVAITILGVIFALDPNSSVFEIVSFAWAGFGAAFGPVVLLALFWKRSNKWGALVSMVSGGAMVFIWKFLIAPHGGAWSIYELLPAFVIALVLNVVVSLLTGKPSKEVEETFDFVASGKPLE